MLNFIPPFFMYGSGYEKSEVGNDLLTAITNYETFLLIFDRDGCSKPYPNLHDSTGLHVNYEYIERELIQKALEKAKEKFSTIPQR